MEGLARILVVVVVVVALATRVSMQVENMQWALEQRCRDNGGHQASPDFVSASQQLLSCTGVREIKSEMISSFIAGGTGRQILQKACQQKDKMVRCGAEYYEVMKRCFSEEEKVGIDRLERFDVSLKDFICDHIDDYATLMGSRTELLCWPRLERILQTCFTKETGMQSFAELPMKIINSLAALDLQCNTYVRVQQCAIAADGRCKDSLVFRMFNEATREALGASICSQTAIAPQTGTAPQTAGGTVPKPLVLLILAANVLYSLSL